MITQQSSPETAWRQLCHRARPNTTRPRRTGSYEIAVPRHSFVAVLNKSDGSPPGAPRGGG
jgi:hypothetical protein